MNTPHVRSDRGFKGSPSFGFAGVTIKQNVGSAGREGPEGRVKDGHTEP